MLRCRWLVLGNASFCKIRENYFLLLKKRICRFRKGKFPISEIPIGSLISKYYYRTPHL